jgi:hypothetical protein
VSLEDDPLQDRHTDRVLALVANRHQYSKPSGIEVRRSNNRLRGANFVGKNFNLLPGEMDSNRFSDRFLCSPTTGYLIRLDEEFAFQRGENSFDKRRAFHRALYARYFHNIYPDSHNHVLDLPNS